MPKLVINPKGRYSWEANFNPALRMSNNAISSVMFKMDVERTKFNSVIKRLDGEAKTELRISRREIDQVKRELQELKAYQKVAELTAFKTFDPEVKRRAREREDQQLQRQLQQEEEKVAQELDDYEEMEKDGIRRRLERKRREEENRREISYANMLLLSRKASISDGTGALPDKELTEVQLRNRRLSSTGNVFVTLKDIMDNDDVLQRHSDDIMNARRPSQELGSPSRRASQDFALSSRRTSHAGLDSNSRRQSRVSLSSKRRSSNAMSSSAPDLSDKAGSKFPPKNARDNVVPNPGKEDQSNGKESPSHILNRTFSKLISERRRSRIGSIGSLVQQVIQEHKDCYESDDNVDGEDKDCAKSLNDKSEARKFDEPNNSSNIFITDISESNEDTDVEDNPKSISNQQRRSLLGKAIKASKRGDSPGNACAYSDCVDSEVVPPLKLEGHGGLFEVLNQLKRKKEENVEVEEVTEADQSEKESSGETTVNQDRPTGKPGLLRGLARFKSMANIVTEKNREAREDRGVSQIKRLTAAVVMANCAAQGKVPSAFMMHYLSPAIRSETRRRAPKLETVHKESSALKLRPLQMPRSVQRQHEKKFEELMATINGAVHWKVRALRENTGTLNPRQLRRKQREQELEQQQQQKQQKQQEKQKQLASPKQQQQKQQQQPQVQHRGGGDFKAQPVLNIRPRRERMELPGACTTTWSLKRFVQKEIRDLLASWQPENARKLRCQRLKSLQ